MKADYSIDTVLWRFQVLDRNPYLFIPIDHCVSDTSIRF